jgi:hypothetical protein
MRRLLFVGVWLLGVVGLWWPMPPAPHATWHVPADRVAVAVTADGRVVTVGSRPAGAADAIRRGPVEGWDIGTGGRIWSAFADADWLTAYWEQGSVRIYQDDRRTALDVRSGRPVPEPDHPFAGRPGAIMSPDRSVAFVESQTDGQAEPQLVAHNMTTGRQLYELPAGVNGCIFSPGGRFAAGLRHSGDGRREAVWWEVSTGPQGRTPCDVPLAALGPEGDVVLTGDGALRDVATGAVRVAAGDPGRLDDARLMADGRYLIASRYAPDPPRTVLTWYDTATGARLADRSREFPDSDSLSFVASSSEFGSVVGRYLELETHRSPRPARGWWAWPVRWLGVPPDAPVRRRLLIDTQTGREVLNLPAEQHVWDYSPDGRQVVACQLLDTGVGGRLTLWRVPPQPSPRLFAAFAVGWAVVLVLIARRLRRPAGPASH